MLATANGLKESLGEYWTDGLVILWLKPRSGTRRFNQRPPSTSVREIISSNGGFNLRFCIPEKTRPPASDSIGFAGAGDCRKYKKSSLPGAFVLRSGQRDSDPRSQPWQGCALPTKLCPHVFHLGGQRVENIQERPPSRKPGVSRFCGAGLAAAPHDGQT